MDIPGYISELDRNTGDVMQLLKECTEAQLEAKKGEEWSILEILEHLLITDRAVYRLLMAPSKKQHGQPEIVGRQKMNRLMVDMRSYKVVAPDSMQPKGEIKNNSAFIEQFLKERAALVEALENGKITLDNGVFKHPMIGEMTKSDWLHFIVTHTQRHLLQIKDRLAGK